MGRLAASMADMQIYGRRRAAGMLSVQSACQTCSQHYRHTNNHGRYASNMDDVQPWDNRLAVIELCPDNDTVVLVLILW
jgi:hypothetical protein